MKRIVSLFLCVIMLFSVSMIVFAEQPTIEVTLTPSKTTLEAGEAFTVTLTVNSTEECPVWVSALYVDYDSNILERVTGSDVKDSTFFDGMCELYDADENSVYVQMSTNDPKVYTNLCTIGFKVKDDVTSGTVNFNMYIDDQNGFLAGPDGDYFYATSEEITWNNASVTIGGSEPDPEPAEFGVTATVDNEKTVVTVANKGELAGLVYAASYDADDVLVNCAPAQTLANGTLTFTGITGKVKVFVWDENNAPLWDTFITPVAAQ